MQVSVRYTAGATPGYGGLAMVAFEFGSVRTPHEFLQDEMRWRSWITTPENQDRTAHEIKVALMDKHRGLLGRRGCLWVGREALHVMESIFFVTGGETPWDEKQVMCPSTLVWTAKRVPEAHYRVPVLAGLTPSNPLHDAVQQAVLMQGGFRALSLNKDFPTRSARRVV